MLSFFNTLKSTISRKLRETLFTQGDTRKLNDNDFRLYKNLSGSPTNLRCEKDFVSIHQNQIGDVVDFETFNQLKELSFKVQNLEETIKFKLMELNTTTDTTTNITTNSNTNNIAPTFTTITTSNTAPITTTVNNNSASTSININNKSKKFARITNKTDS